MQKNYEKMQKLGNKISSVVFLFVVVCAFLWFAIGEGVFLEPKAENHKNDISNAEIVTNFKKVAFGAEVILNTKEKDYNKIRKWNKNIKIAVISDEPDKFDRITAVNVVQIIQKETNLNINSVSSTKEADIIIWSSDDFDFILSDMKKLTNDNIFGKKLVNHIKNNQKRYEKQCFGFSFYDKNNYNMKISFVVLNNNKKKYKVSCYYEEIIRSMGFENTSNDIKSSIFNDDHKYKLPTKSDRLMLRILYDPRIKAGMTKEEALPIARQILREIRPEGER